MIIDTTEFYAKNNNDILELLKYAKGLSSDKIKLEDDDLQEFINTVKGEAIIHKLTDNEILNNVLGSQEDSKSES